jgi:ribonuclease D
LHLFLPDSLNHFQWNNHPAHPPLLSKDYGCFKNEVKQNMGRYPGSPGGNAGCRRKAGSSARNKEKAFPNRQRFPYIVSMHTIDSCPGFATRMTKEEINACPIRRWEGVVRVIRTTAELRQAVSALAAETILGFDTETRPAYHKGESYLPSLLQLAGEKEVYLFQLKHLGLPAPLREILANPKVVKAGVALAFDLQELHKLARFKPAGFVDLGRLAKEAEIKNHGLRGLAAVLLGFRIAKGAQTSNWSRDVLTQAQIQYAATDAWVGRELYLRLSTITKQAYS